MGTHLVGLDIGSSGIRAAEVNTSRGISRLRRYAEVPLAPGVLDHGMLKDSEALKDALRQLWKTGGFKTKNVAIAVNGPTIVVRTIELPEEYHEEKLAEQLPELLPMPPEEAIVDYLPVEEFVGSDGTAMLRLLVVAAPESEVDPIVEAVLQSGLTPKRVDLAPIAAARALVAEHAKVDARESEIVIDMGATTTSIVVSSDGAPRLIRILPGGGDDMTAALATDLECEPSEAFIQKSVVGISPVPISHEVSGATGVLERHLGKTVSEIIRSVDYYRQSVDAATPTRCVLTGGGSQIAGLRERLEHELGIPVQHADPFARFDDVPLPQESRDDASRVAAVAVGLAVA